MKKIIVIMALVMCLTACGNNDMKENVEVNKIKNEEITINLSEEDNMIGEKIETEGNKNIEELEPERNKEIEDVVAKKNEDPEKIEEKVKEATERIVECVEDQTAPGVNSVDEKTVYEEGVEVGKKAIDFEVELLSGEKVRLSDYLGKPVFLNFWATLCGPCVGEMPDIEKIKNEYGDRLVVLAINGGELKEDVDAFIKRKGYTFRVGLDEKSEILETYDSMYIPLSIFIDENGVIRERRVGALKESEMKEIVTNLVETK